MAIQPLKDKILVRPIVEDEKTDSGIVIPDTVSKEKPQKGEVIAVGKGRTTPEGKNIPIEIKAGDKVLFTKYSPREIEHEGEDFLILSEDDVLAVIN